MISALPSEFSWIKRSLDENTYGKDAQCRVLTSSEEASAIVEWGRQKLNGQSIVRIAFLDERMDLSDLKNADWVEPYALGPIQSAVILNDEDSIRVLWTCEYCDRRRSEQVKDLLMHIHRRVSVQHVWNDEWLLDAKYRDVASKYGLRFRSIEQNDRYLQICVEEGVEVCEDTFPIERSEPRCAGCGLLRIFREELVEGVSYYGSKSDEIVIKRTVPVSIRRPQSDYRMLRSRFLLGNADTSDVPVHKVGELADSVTNYSGSFDLSPIHVMRTDLACDLLLAGVNGLGFRPLLIVD